LSAASCVPIFPSARAAAAATIASLSPSRVVNASTAVGSRRSPSASIRPTSAVPLCLGSAARRAAEAALPGICSRARRANSIASASSSSFASSGTWASVPMRSNWRQRNCLAAFDILASPSAAMSRDTIRPRCAGSFEDWAIADSMAKSGSRGLPWS